MEVNYCSLVLRGLRQVFFSESSKLAVLSGFSEEPIGPLSSIRQDF